MVSVPTNLRRSTSESLPGLSNYYSDQRASVDACSQEEQVCPRGQKSAATRMDDGITAISLDR